MEKNSLPSFETMMNPTLQALRELGGSATIEEIVFKVSEIMSLSDDELSIIHDPEKSGRTEIEYRLAWTRTYLKGYGLLENSKRGVWSLTAKGRQTETVSSKKVSRFVRDQRKKTRVIKKRQ